MQKKDGSAAVGTTYGYETNTIRIRIYDTSTFNICLNGMACIQLHAIVSNIFGRCALFGFVLLCVLLCCGRIDRRQFQFEIHYLMYALCVRKRIAKVLLFGS